tara:strand:- start:2059 stop:2295 length:237 start_codon:yes stop_codon:yes gene_type:complete
VGKLQIPCVATNGTAVVCVERRPSSMLDLAGLWNRVTGWRGEQPVPCSRVHKLLLFPEVKRLQLTGAVKSPDEDDAFG